MSKGSTGKATRLRLSADDLIRCLGAEVEEVLGDTGIGVDGPAALSDPGGGGSVTFCGASGEDAVRKVVASPAAVVICHADVAHACRRAGAQERTYIVVANPRLAFARVLAALFAPARPEGIHETAVVDPGSTIGERVSIGPYACIGAASVGDGTVIHGHVHVYPGTVIGSNVTIHAGAVIGADGFGYERNDEGRLEKFPQIGNVVIEDDVEIGANACIDRGTLGSTIIRRGAKLDNLVYVAHNVVIGRDALVIALAAVMGSTTVGDGTWISPGATLRDKIAVGRGVTVGLGAVVVNDVPDGTVVAGIPAKPMQGRGKI